MAQHEVADYSLDQIRNALASLGVTEEKFAQQIRNDDRLWHETDMPFRPTHVR
jgi:hypothetical protein